MAPEQLESKAVDNRTDIFAFGAVLYEMISGEKAFNGESQASLITAIMSGVPRPLTDAATLVPSSLDHLVAKSLSKDKDGRWQTARDLTTELQWIVEARKIDANEPVANPKSEGSRPWKFATGAACILALVLGWLSLRQSAPADEPPIRFTLPAPASSVDFALSPNGRLLVYTGSGKLWMRPLDALEAESVTATVSARTPFWSPDSRYVGFFEQGKLKRLDLVDGSILILCDAAQSAGATWNDEGTIVFSRGLGPLFRVPATGGEPVAATRLDTKLQEAEHRSPSFLPDGRRFLYLGRRSNQAHTGIFVGSLDSVETKHFVTGADSSALYTPPGFLVFMREGNLFAQEFDADRLELRGEPVIVAQDIAASGGTMAVSTVSATGVLAYRGVGPTHRMVRSLGQGTWCRLRARYLRECGSFER